MSERMVAAIIVAIMAGVVIGAILAKSIVLEDIPDAGNNGTG